MMRGRVGQGILAKIFLVLSDEGDYVKNVELKTRSPKIKG